MTIELLIRPNITVSWDDFCLHAPKFSIALDGYVEDAPKFNSEKCVANFNHHSGVDRLATRATCAQVLMAIRQGMFSTFRDECGAKARVYVNDCDEDVCTSWFLLKYNHLVVGTMNPLINRLVAMEDALDATAGAYPFPADLPALQELAWIYQPYRQLRLSGGLDTNDPLNKGLSYKSVIVDVENRIMRYLLGQGEKLPLDTRYDVIGGGNGWVMVKELGGHARTGMFGDGIKAYVSVRERDDNTHGTTYTYTIGKLSPFIPFDLLKLTNTLNEQDLAVGENNKWGGGNNIMGSPRETGSCLHPDTLSKIIKENL